MRRVVIGLVSLLLISSVYGNVDPDPPTADITDVTPRSGTILSWNTTITVTGTATDAVSLSFYQVSYRYTNRTTDWTQINGNKTDPVSASTLITATGFFMGEMIEFKLYAEDAAANTATDTFPKAGDAITTLQVESHPAGTGPTLGGVIGSM